MRLEASSPKQPTKLRPIEDAISTLDGMLQRVQRQQQLHPDAEQAYAALIRAARAGNAGGAVKALHRLSDAPGGAGEDAVRLTVLTCAAQGRMDQALALASATSVDKAAQTRWLEDAITVCRLSGSHDALVQLFDAMRESGHTPRRPGTYQALMAVHFERQQWAEVLRTLDEVTARGVPLTVHVLNEALKATNEMRDFETTLRYAGLASKHSLRPNLTTYLALLRAHAALGHGERCEALVEEARASSMDMPLQAAWLDMPVLGWAHAEQWARCIAVLQRRVTGHPPMTSTALYDLLDVCVSKREWQHAVAILHVAADPASRVRGLYKAHEKVVRCLAEAGRVDLAVGMLQDMGSRFEKLREDAFAPVLAECGADSEYLPMLLEQMRQHGVQLGPLSTMATMQHMVSVGRLAEATDLALASVRSGVRFSAPVFNSLLDALVARGDTANALRTTYAVREAAAAGMPWSFYLARHCVQTWLTQESGWELVLQFYQQLRAHIVAALPDPPSLRALLGGASDASEAKLAWQGVSAPAALMRMVADEDRAGSAAPAPRAPAFRASPSPFKLLTGEMLPLIMQACLVGNQWRVALDVLAVVQAVEAAAQRGAIPFLPTVAATVSGTGVVSRAAPDSSSMLAGQQHTLSLAIRACSRARAWPATLALFTAARETHGVRFHVQKYMLALQACRRLRDGTRALQVFDWIAEDGLRQDAMAYCRLAGALAQSREAGHYDLLLQLPERMLTARVAPLDPVLSVVVEACAERDQPARALALLASLAPKHKPEQLEWRAVLLLLLRASRSGHHDEALEALSLLVHATEQSAFVAGMSFYSVAKPPPAAAASARGAEAATVPEVSLRLTRRASTPPGSPALSAARLARRQARLPRAGVEAVLHSCARAQDAGSAGEIAEDVLAGALAQDMSLAPHAFVDAMAACTRAEHWDAALEVLQAARRELYVPPKGCFDLAIHAYAARGQWELAVCAFEDIKSFKLGADPSSYLAVLRACVAAGQQQRALPLLEEAARDATLPDAWFASLALDAAQHHAWELVLRVADVAGELGVLLDALPETQALVHQAQAQAKAQRVVAPERLQSGQPAGLQLLVAAPAES